MIKNIEKIITEEFSKTTKEDFFKRNQIEPDAISYAGSGDYGKAYYVNGDRILKITSSEKEFEYAYKIKETNAPILDVIVEIYDVAIVDGAYYILMEEVDIDEQIEYMFWQVMDILNQQGLDILHINGVDEEELEGELDQDLIDFMDELNDIVRAYSYLGVYPPDIRPENLGYDKEGKLKAFDIDERG